jgi:hypothetical protein
MLARPGCGAVTSGAGDPIPDGHGSEMGLAPQLAMGKITSRLQSRLAAMSGGPTSGGRGARRIPSLTVRVQKNVFETASSGRGSFGTVR